MPEDRPRERIGDLAVSEVKRKDSNPLKKELRQEVFRQFVINKFKRKLGRHVEYIVGTREISGAVKYLFDEHGVPPENVPLEDIVAKRVDLEAQLKWLDVISAELRNTLTSVKEIEDSANALMETEKSA